MQQTCELMGTQWQAALQAGFTTPSPSLEVEVGYSSELREDGRQGPVGMGLQDEP
ncbi:hypothetical protein LWF15_24155 [Kineosporia rhizophila]|uniref:hypothetical protein n=1 Tax=Kineosporia TaxID=49184 RepID=UPI001E32FE5E|nr:MULTISPECIES: hypothetical protein [Kineosporia]MCE0538597.1 hypothetical protein [Kineosporia rhizophila]